MSITDLILPPEVFAASPALMCMCFAAGLNVAVTRTPFASPLILACLSGQPNVMAPALCAALASLFVTRSSKFIGPQRDRADLKFVGDLQPLGRPSHKSTLSPSESSGDGDGDGDDDGDDFQAEAPTIGLGSGNGRRGSVNGPDAEMGSLLTEDDSPRGYSAIADGYSKDDVARALKAALQTNS